MVPSQRIFPVSRARSSRTAAQRPSFVSVENGLMAALIAVVLFLTMTDASARLPGLSFVSDHQVSRGF